MLPPAARNVISEIYWRRTQWKQQRDRGNFIGTDPTGTQSRPNGTSGIEVNGSGVPANNLIGGTVAGAGNLISGNPTGLRINSPGNTVQGNLIGTDPTGTQAVPNGSGVNAGANNTLIGGLTPAARNVISGNTGDGIRIGGTGSKLQGNFIGTDITGMIALGNGGSGVLAGNNALVGGTTPEARNVISSNAGNGNISLGSNGSGDGATVQGNYISTDVTGNRALSNPSSGISISGFNNLIGGLDPGATNVISGNLRGIELGGLTTASPSGNVIQGNFIGLNAQGNAPLPNGFRGIEISAANTNTVGGTQAGAANKIAFNGGEGVLVSSSSTANSIRGNSIFSNTGLGIDLNPIGLSPNDPGDGDSGANLHQNFPVLTSVVSSSGTTTIQEV